MVKWLYQLGDAYLSLGYTGQAGMHIIFAKRLLDSTLKDVEDTFEILILRINWQLSFSLYHCALESMDER